MHRRRFFLTRPFAGGTLPIEAGDLHHLRDVLRMRPGSMIETVDPAGRVLHVRIDSLGPKGVIGTALGVSGWERRTRLVLCQGISKGKKMDLVVQKATELGVAEIVPFLSERSVVRLGAAKAVERAERWSRVASEAAKQCGRPDVPRVEVALTLAELEPFVGGAANAIVLWEEAAVPLRKRLEGMQRSSTAVVIGPEGGLSRQEVQMLESWGARQGSLGDVVLRTETAGIAATAILAYELGWLGGAGGPLG